VSNNSKHDFEITAGDRIGQIVFYKHELIKPTGLFGPGPGEFDADGKNTSMPEIKAMPRVCLVGLGALENNLKYFDTNGGESGGESGRKRIQILATYL